MNKIKWYLLFSILIVGLTSSGIIDLRDLFNYAHQDIPDYITRTNIPADNPITDGGATLGRVLFYDKGLSFNNKASCAKCHRQFEDFGDTEIISTGAVGPPKRHTMRIGFVGLSEETRAFWNERANTIEAQSTIPIHDDKEMGFSGKFGQPDFDSLLRKMNATQYYPILFKFVFGDSVITEGRMQLAMGQFLRSIRAFDTKYDTGRLAVSSELADFPNFTAQENEGKRLFNTLPKEGGAGCFQCHIPPEFGIRSDIKNNGNIGIIHGPEKFDTAITKAPSLRNLVTPSGKELGPFMHDGKHKTLSQVLDHYISLDKKGPIPNIDPRLVGPDNNIELDEGQKEAVIAFLKTLTSVDVFTGEQWSDPFVNDSLEVIPLMTGVRETLPRYASVSVFPNPSSRRIHFRLPAGYFRLKIIDVHQNTVLSKTIGYRDYVDIEHLRVGTYIIRLDQMNGPYHFISKLLKL